MSAGYRVAASTVSNSTPSDRDLPLHTGLSWVIRHYTVAVRRVNQSVASSASDWLSFQEDEFSWPEHSLWWIALNFSLLVKRTSAQKAYSPLSETLSCGMAPKLLLQPLLSVDRTIVWSTPVNTFTPFAPYFTAISLKHYHSLYCLYYFHWKHESKNILKINLLSSCPHAVPPGPRAS